MSEPNSAPTDEEGAAMSQHDPTPIETALDLLVFAPIGLAITVGEEVPKLAAKGRARLNGPFAAALMLGRFAATQGRRELDRRIGGVTGPGRGRSTAPAEPVEPTADAGDADGGWPEVGLVLVDDSRVNEAAVDPIEADESVVVTLGVDPDDGVEITSAPVAGELGIVGSDPAATVRRRRRRVTAEPAGPPSGLWPADPDDVPAAASLAIPGYDSLSASQVVQRLAGLSGPELEAVRTYETARRGRRTILARVTQLQAR
jgi:hypothetical protein